MKLQTQLLIVNKNKEQDATITFACSLKDLQEIEKFVDEIRVVFWITDAQEDKIIGEIAGTSISASATDKHKFKIKAPSSENIRTSQLSTLCGKELELNIEVDSDV